MAKAQSPPVARQLSVRAIMEAILHKGPTSRAMLAKLTGLSRQTTTQVVLELERDGLLQVSGRMQGPVGRSAPTYELNPRAAYVLGIRLEGSAVQMALADIRGDLVAELSEPTHPSGGLEVVRQLGRLFVALLATAHVERDRVRFGVMGSPGVVDPKSGRIDIAPSIPHLGDINVVESVRSELGVELTIENGVKLAALGELWQGEARGARNFVYFGIGSGVGMGIVSEGKLLRGARGAAGEIAYLPIGGDPFDPAGFANGTFESSVDSAAIVRRYEGYGGEPDQDVAAILARLDTGDRFAAAAIDETARLLVLAISAACAVVDPELIVLGGSVGARPEISRRVGNLLPRAIPRPLPVRSSALGNRATLVGALGQALNRLHANLFGVEAVRGESTPTTSFAAPPETARSNAP
ncbi:ROK family transcriptional regulator [Devosia sp. ZB163]|uniref:ROK family transcriptional regulator n=1 Tax=Devosia sp. ZB163 TaxID=3025938 RepID=UPI002362188B|nr:ROK family transcriptional regulator [Devosia sp. ZB163]MDC9825151.1 ROK family transcriptional regulator [Devosia sp. ZB163]